MKIEINNLAGEKIDLRLVKKAVIAFSQGYKISENKEISLAFVDDAEIKKLNKIYRGLNQATDILSFAGAGGFLGELVINYGQIKRQAESFGRSARQELVFILAHGLLHLIGYDDKTEPGRLKMIRRGEEFVKKLIFYDKVK